MAEFWNPYLTPSDGQRRLLGAGAVAAVLLLWSGLAASGLVSPTRLPAPWDVAGALSYLAWNEGESLLLMATAWSVGRLVVAGILVVSIGIPRGIVMGALNAHQHFLLPALAPLSSEPAPPPTNGRR